ncbi:type II secretion system F family protein [Cohnella lupini]|uniref:Tight adherence protein C n=1 Tax=Cohnella lupini TaxID=1294267 RepID=A0A3D9HZ94_9BACL|nr:type II secretion system F family protein [Cohnella lupini]RED54755.1 tight adherence protein C [Cohnella lupini]
MIGGIMILIVAGMSVLYVVLLFRAWRKGKPKRIRPNVDPFVILLHYRPLLARLQPLLQRQRICLAILNGGACPLETLVAWAAECVGLAYFMLLISCLLGVASNNSALFMLGILVSGCLLVLRSKELSDKVSKRRQAIVMEMPELLSRLLLMVNAGENVMRALARSIEQKHDSANPLYMELKAAIEGMKRGESLATALEEMGRRCAVPEVKLFATTLLINARRGGDAFVPALRELTRQMWDKRKAIARTLGEQASSRLAFPLAVVFLLIMVLVGAPTVLMM